MHPAPVARRRTDFRCELGKPARYSAEVEARLAIGTTKGRQKMTESRRSSSGVGVRRAAPVPFGKKSRRYYAM